MSQSHPRPALILFLSMLTITGQQAAAQEIPPASPPPVPTLAPVAASPTVPAAPQEQWTGMHRFYSGLQSHVGLGGSYSYYNGLAEHRETYGSLPSIGLTLGYEYIHRLGLNLGVEWTPRINPVDIFESSGDFSVRLGYATKSFGVDLAAGSYSLGRFSIGPVVRIGRYDGTYVLLRYLWAPASDLSGAAQLLPADAQVDLFVPLGKRVRLNLRATAFDRYQVTNESNGSASAGVKIEATAGAQIYLSGNGIHRTNILNLGGGVFATTASLGSDDNSPAPPFVGPAFHVEFERRF